MGPIFKNHTFCRLAADLASGATTAYATSGGGAGFAGASVSDYIPVTLIRVSGYKEVAWEEAWVTGRSTDTLTLVREKESSTGLDFYAGDLIACRPTAGTVPALNDSGSAVTPVIVSSGGGTAVYSAQLGYQHVINSWCSFMVDVTLSDLGTLAAGTVTITGLANSAHASYGQAACLLKANNLAASVAALSCSILPGTAVITPMVFAAGSSAAITVAELAATSRLIVSGTYRLA